MASASIDFTNHFVAFVDILGFSDMVRHDSTAADGARLFAQKLFDAHQEINSLASGVGKSIHLTQFSDSIVISQPVMLADFPGFLELVASFQLLLFEKGILCRGGVAYGKHFSSQSFIFSDAMITAYRIESTLARFPRIVVSPDLIELFDPIPASVGLMLLKEDDGASFVDYLNFGRRQGKDIKGGVEQISASIPRNAAPPVLEKLRWLLQYSDTVLGTTMAPRRFSSL